MFGSFNPVQEMPLTLVTEKLVIQGDVVTRVKRLTDLLNEPDTVHLVLQDAVFMDLGSRRIVATGVAAQVRLSEVLFVHSNGPAEAGSFSIRRRINVHLRGKPISWRYRHLPVAHDVMGSR